MPMQMGFRWYGEGNDKISLSDIEQIPGVTSIVWALHNKMPGEVWEVEEIEEARKQGVMVLFSNTIYSGRDIQKVNNYKIDAFYCNMETEKKCHRYRCTPIKTMLKS